MIKRMMRLVYAVIVALGVLVAAEGMCRFFYRDDVAFVRDPDHRLSANTAETNADGIRTKREAREFTEDAQNVVFLGDSFVFGGREYPELALPAQFERTVRARHPGCKINVANFGWVSSSPYLSLRLLKDIGRKYSPDVVVLGVDMTDFHEDLKYRLLIERPTLIYKALRYLPGVIVVTKKALVKLARFRWARRLHEVLFRLPTDAFFMVNQPLEETEPLASAILENIRKIADFTRTELHAKFVLLIFPRSFQYSAAESPNNWERDAYTVLGPYSLEPFVLFERVRASFDFPVYSLLHVFQTTTVFPTVMYDDPHWTERGTKLVAEYVSDLFDEQRLWSCEAGLPSPNH